MRLVKFPYERLRERTVLQRGWRGRIYHRLVVVGTEEAPESAER